MSSVGWVDASPSAPHTPSKGVERVNSWKPLTSSVRPGTGGSIQSAYEQQQQQQQRRPAPLTSASLAAGSTSSNNNSPHRSSDRLRNLQARLQHQSANIDATLRLTKVSASMSRNSNNNDSVDGRRSYQPASYRREDADKAQVLRLSQQQQLQRNYQPAALLVDYQSRIGGRGEAAGMVAARYDDEESEVASTTTESDTTSSIPYSHNTNHQRGSEAHGSTRAEPHAFYPDMRSTTQEERLASMMPWRKGAQLSKWNKGATTSTSPTKQTAAKQTVVKDASTQQIAVKSSFSQTEEDDGPDGLASTVRPHPASASAKPRVEQRSRTMTYDPDHIPAHVGSHGRLMSPAPIRDSDRDEGWNASSARRQVIIDEFTPNRKSAVVASSPVSSVKVTRTPPPQQQLALQRPLSSEWDGGAPEDFSPPSGQSSSATHQQHPTGAKNSEVAAEDDDGIEGASAKKLIQVFESIAKQHAAAHEELNEQERMKREAQLRARKAQIEYQAALEESAQYDSPPQDDPSGINRSTDSPGSAAPLL